MPEPLAICGALFERLDAAGVRHAHWTHNDRLAEALTGRQPLELLVEADRAAEVQGLLGRLGFRRFESATPAPEVEDWIGFDRETGALVHVFLRVQLVLGTPALRAQRLPWEALVLETTVRDEATGLRVTHPALELVLLLVRAALAQGPVPARAQAADDPWRRAFDHFFDRVDLRDVEAFAHRILPPAEAQRVVRALVGREHERPAVLAEIRRGLDTTLRPHRGPIAVQALARRPLEALRSAAARVARQASEPAGAGRRLASGGALVAVIGCDGAGKSTVAAELARWLAHKADARTIYLGVGEGPGGLRVRALRRLKPRRPAVAVPAVLREIGTGLLHNAMADERAEKLRAAHAFREAGGILLTDRFPQTQFPGIYDGPRATRSDRESVVRRTFAEREARLYEKMGEMAPDVVIKLHVPVDVALARKPGHDEAGIRRKCDLTVALQFPRSKVFDVDAARPLDDVLLDCKRILWENL